MFHLFNLERFTQPNLYAFLLKSHFTGSVPGVGSFLLEQRWLVWYNGGKYILVFVSRVNLVDNII